MKKNSQDDFTGDGTGENINSDGNMDMKHYALFTPTSLIQFEIQKGDRGGGDAIFQINEFHYKLEAEKIKITTDFDIGKKMFHEDGGFVYVMPLGSEENLRLPDGCKEIEVVELLDIRFGNKRSFQDRIMNLLRLDVKVFSITPEILNSRWDEAILSLDLEGWDFIWVMANKVQFVFGDDPEYEDCSHIPWFVEKVEAN